jgi:hypothetical protein
MKKLIFLSILFTIPMLTFASAGDFIIRSFDVYYQGTEVKITWQTGMAAQKGTFFIERSSDASTFEEIAIASANEGESSISYLEVDRTPLAGTSFYRIKQITQDGFTIYSPIRTIKNYETLALEMNLTSNPCDASFKEELKKLGEEEILVVMRDEKGAEHYAKINLTNDECKIKAKDKNKELEKGDYVITSSSKNELYSQVITIK